jgi:hypothetical protein
MGKPTDYTIISLKKNGNCSLVRTSDDSVLLVEVPYIVAKTAWRVLAGNLEDHDTTELVRYIFQTTGTHFANVIAGNL